MVITWESIIYIGAVVAAISTILVFAMKLMTPIKTALDTYNKTVKDMMYRTEQTEKFIQEHSVASGDMNVCMNKTHEEVRAILRFIVNAECYKAKMDGYQHEPVTKDLEIIYQLYHDEGMNGLGSKNYHEYLELPSYVEWKEGQK